MISTTTIADTYHDLDCVIEHLITHKAELKLIEAVNVAQKVLLAFELMGITSKARANSPN